jgi:ubiquinone/menaquinone biosynthesis C-methylase UbiE
VGDLAVLETLPEDSFDCLVITQTLQLIYNVSAAVRVLHRALKPAGIALITVPGISQIDSRIAWYWSFTKDSASRIFSEAFGGQNIEVNVYGNVFAATAFLQGIAVEEVDKKKLDVFDPNYPVIITICAQKNK